MHLLQRRRNPFDIWAFAPIPDRREMVRNTFLMMTAAGLVLAFAGCHRNADNQTAAVENGTTNAAEATGNAISNAADDVKEAVTPTPTGQEFADKAAKSDAFEIASAKLAREKSASPAIKSFAAMMIEDHTASTAKVKKAASEASPGIKPDPTLTADQNGKLADLRKLAGADFDKEYVDQQIDAHTSALSLMQIYAEKGDVASLKSAAGAIAPKVEAHLDKIRSIKDKL